MSERPVDERGDAQRKPLDEQLEVLGFAVAGRTARPLRILGLMPWREFWSMGRGAGATAFTRSPVALAAFGHEMHVLHPGEPGQAASADFGGVRFHRFRAPEAFANPHRPLPARLWSRFWRYHLFQAALLRQGLRLGRELRPDVVIAYDVMTAPAARRIARQLGVPLVGRYFGNTISLGLHNRLRWYGNFMERTGFRVPVQAMILTNDGSPVLEVLRRLRVDRTPIHFLRNGLPADVFKPGPRPVGMLAKVGLPEDAFVIMSVTRLHSEKRLDRLIGALALLRREVPSAVAIVLGQGPEREALEALVAQLGLGDAVRFPGPVKNVDLADWYRLSDIVISLLDRTNASNPVFEAMACERCVVALDVGTTAEVVRDGETGVLVASGDEAAIVSGVAATLGALARDRERRLGLGRRARPFILELCGTVETRMRREVGIIEEVARTGRVVRGNLELE
jgi:glycosyltransferase involved in cell wall biosynthesis